MRDALRLLEARQQGPTALRRLAEEGRQSGLSEDDGEAVFDRLEAKYRALSNAD